MKTNAIISLAVAVCLLVLACAPAPEKEPEKGRAAASGIHPIVAWIMACRTPAGGFGCFPGDSAFVSRTGMAVEALFQLGGLRGMPEAQATVRWLQGMQQPDGGFIERADFYSGKELPWGGMSGLEPTFWAVRALKYLGAGPERPEEAARFVRARQLSSGAFDASEIGWGGATQAVYSTWWAMATLKELGQPVPDSARVVEWVKRQQDTEDGRGGFRLSEDNFNYSSTAGTYYAVQTLTLLGAPVERRYDVKKFLLSGYGQEADGGFEIGHGDDWNNFDHYSLMQDTWMAVSTLRSVGLPLSDSDTSRAARPATDCAAWVTSLQNADGGFARVGVTDQTPVRSPSEMRATWQAVGALKLLGREVPRPERPVEPVNEVQVHVPLHKSPLIDYQDPVNVWAYRRIALPIYEHFLAETGSRVKALGWLSRWARAVVGPENASYLTEGRGLLQGGWGQCGQMSQLMQQLALSVDHASRYSFIQGDVNCEILVQEDGWDLPHWCLFIPFTNEYPDPGRPTPRLAQDGWSVLDVIVSHNQRSRNLNYPSITLIGDHLFNSVRVETVDYEAGRWGHEVKMDSTTTYDSPQAAELYPEGSW